MALKYSTAAKNAMLDALDTQCGAAATFKVWTAAKALLLAEMNCANPAFKAAATGAIELDTDTDLQDTSADNAGTAAVFTIAANGTTDVIEGTVAESGGDIDIDNAVIAAGQTVTLTSLTITAGTPSI